LVNMHLVTNVKTARERSREIADLVSALVMWPGQHQL